MKRRAFIAALGGGITYAVTSVAQQRPKTIAFLGASTESAQIKWTAAFEQRLREHGWIQGQTVTIDYRWAEGSKDRMVLALEDFVRRNPDVIVAHGNQVVLLAKEAITRIPIVFPVASEAVEAGMVASLARPGGNLTGLSLQRSDTASKRIELIREVLPGRRRLAVMTNREGPGSLRELGVVREIALPLGLEIIALEISTREEISATIEAVRGRADALYVVAEPLVFVNRSLISSLAIAARLPTFFSLREYVDAGGLLSYGENFPDMFRRAADLVDKVLRGAKPADIPVERPTRYDLVINLKTAKAIGLEVHELMLARADEVIE